jgi:hypothetical protein
MCHGKLTNLHRDFKETYKGNPEQVQDLSDMKPLCCIGYACFALLFLNIFHILLSPGLNFGSMECMICVRVLCMCMYMCVCVCLCVPNDGL